MSRIQGPFEKLRKAGRKALIPYVTAGDPDPAATVPMMHAMVEAGAPLVGPRPALFAPRAPGPPHQRGRGGVVRPGWRDGWLELRHRRRGDYRQPYHPGNRGRARIGPGPGGRLPAR